MPAVIERAIIVVGIGGLCAAIALRRIGVEAVVYEQAPQLNAGGAALVMWPNALKALRHLGLAEAVIGAGANAWRARRGSPRSHGGSVASGNLITC
jgi:2-polyprenyl-6-methoxyphenol hydroxylase-like FAD-dependent oxidoreductase